MAVASLAKKLFNPSYYSFITLFQGISLIGLPIFSCLVVQRVVRVWGAEQGLNTEKDGTDLKGGTPLVLENVETDAT